jgi:large-conductance mechanosensitive channel
VFRCGHFLNVLAAFVTIAFVIFFLVVKPVTALMSLARTGSRGPSHPQVPRVP